MADQTTSHVYVLYSGLIKLVRVSPAGREITLNIITPTEIFGENDLFDVEACYGVTAEVLEDAEVISFRRSHFAEAVSQSLDALKELVILQYNRRLQAEDGLTDCVFYDVQTRVARLLWRFSVASGQFSQDDSMIHLKLTHQEIANLIGSTRETTTLILNDLRRRGIIEVRGRRIIIADAPGLQQLTD